MAEIQSISTKLILFRMIYCFVRLSPNSLVRFQNIIILETQTHESQGVLFEINLAALVPKICIAQHKSQPHSTRSKTRESAWTFVVLVVLVVRTFWVSNLTTREYATWSTNIIPSRSTLVKSKLVLHTG